MASVTVEGVSKRYGDVDALKDVSIAFEEGGFYGLLGPSGSGKTTLLRLIAGFQFPDEGRILIGGESVTKVPAQKRGVGMMFQSYALFPNMSVFENVAFGLKVRGVSRGEMRRRVGEALDLVQLTGLEARRPQALSGGQRQRVALARAIVIRPKVLLLDEPLSALDKALRKTMQVELRAIQREVAITTIFVTHDQEEALTLSDRIGVLRDGQLVEEGAPRAIYDRPKSAFAATFLGDANLLAGIAQDGAVRLASGDLVVTDDDPGPNGAPVQIAIRPERMSVRAGGEGGEGGLRATLRETIFSGSTVTMFLDCAGTSLRALSANDGSEPPPPGTEVFVAFGPHDAVVVSP